MESKEERMKAMQNSISSIQIMKDNLWDNLEIVRTGEKWKAAAKRARKISLDLAKEMKEFRRLSVRAEHLS